MNGFAEAPEAIPLQPTYLFQASPADGTLKNMLSRWARDRKMSLSYLHANDYTLYEPVADIHTTDLQAAVSALSDAYAAQGVVVAVESNQIVVRAAAAAAPIEVGN
ncbi:toxin co-regulated pilus biosynthesis Q family protein [Marilutibacter chinensis]|uniref:Toxin co-regulated pilus biosynthesis Q family protein n=1 Tax=Marilutibacter chinensis TaxID=2912247 RepID=A0ABS9HTP2_9GAMM|nr:toxin co-regulated pilus biosynthesis Q family protein [Lysobacter chinensis]MCF7221673.1 toxin co-regulated pilus biosynthesis Q family protein [Lysobacter chinensis]